MKVIIFGLGEIGKCIIRQIKDYSRNIKIEAVCDNNVCETIYMGEQVIGVSDILNYDYDEIWITTVYFETIIEQLVRMGIERKRLFYVEPVVPILEERIRESINNGIPEKVFLDDIDEDILEYLKVNKLKMYSYPFYYEYIHMGTEICYDTDVGLYYGVYNGKKMYMAKRYNTEEKARAYFNVVLMEQDKRSPHSYWNFAAFKEKTGCIIDVGAAEGIFGLKLIDYISKLYMIESDPEWVEALTYTYKGFSDKVTIIDRFADDVDSEKSVKLDTLFARDKIDAVKMDIEGMEMKALRGMEEIIERDRPAIAVCVYHHKKDNELIGGWLRDKGYRTENSAGYVVCTGEWELERDEAGFRRALLYAV